MKIASSSIALAAAHAYRETYSRQESLTAWSGDRSNSVTLKNNQALERTEASTLDQLRSQGEELLRGLQDDTLSLSDRALALAPKKAFAPMGSMAERILSKADTGDEIEEPDGLDAKLSLMKMLIEHLTGRKIDLMKASDLKVPDEAQAAAQGENAPEGWGLVYDYYESYEESERLDFKATGIVKTADGQEISLNLSLSMSREFATSQQINIRAGDALKDPLVVNFAGTAAQLGERDFHFDLDADGRMDQIAFVGPGSGFLALDKNGDGRINDGSELFGPTTGSGFAELAVHDEDKNGWIDENDSIYDRLRIWTRDTNGQEQLLGLGQAGVGAIYLGHAESPFLIKDADNQLQGQVKNTGIYLKEDGGVGTVQELDLVV